MYYSNNIYTQPWYYTRTSGTHCLVATKPHDRRCRSSVVGYQVNVYFRHTTLRLAVCHMVHTQHLLGAARGRRGGVWGSGVKSPEGARVQVTSD